MTPIPPSIPLTHFNNFLHPPQGKSCDLSPQMTAEAWLPQGKEVKSAYIHVPFCFHKCHYCDFFSIAGAENHYESFVVQLVRELEYVGGQLDTLDTIFIGGGTPTIFEPQLFDKMLQAVSKCLPRSSQCEWTIEANPETVTYEKAECMVRNGVNRVSIGAQSFHPALLKSLERWHDPENVGKAVECVRSVGIQDINLDVIYAIPSQTMDQLLVDLEQSIALSPTHMSCYSLIYEPNTPLRTRLDRGEVQRVEHELEASMFSCVAEVLQHAGYAQYEISNFAKEGYECKHNISYWTNQAWWPFGPSASGHLSGRRWKNSPRLSEYLSADGLPPILDVETLDSDASAGESFMLGLRLIRGMERSWVESLLAQSNNEWRKGVIEQYIREGQLHWVDDHLALTCEGIRIADTVILALLMQDDEMTDTTEQKKL